MDPGIYIPGNYPFNLNPSVKLLRNFLGAASLANCFLPVFEKTAEGFKVIRW
jgi:hypothetical protein